MVMCFIEAFSCKGGKTQCLKPPTRMSILHPFDAGPGRYFCASSIFKTMEMTTQEVAVRFNELAKQEKWFEIQDELFAGHVKSIEPAHAPYLKNTEGKAPVRKK